MVSSAPLGSAIAAAPSQSDGAAQPGGNASPQIETLRAELDALRATVRQNDDEIDALQLQAAVSRRPWYRSIETLVAIFALLLSLSTTAVSGYWAKTQNDIAEQRLRQQELHESRLELRGLLQAMSDLERQHSELMATQADPLVAIALGSSIAAETSLLANQAYDVIQSIPDHVSSSEYVQVALRLALIYDYNRSEPMFIRAVETATNIYDFTGATRTYGQLLYQTGRPGLGRQQFERALDVWSVFPTGSAAVRTYTDFMTELGWADTLLVNGYCDEVPGHMDNARGHLNSITFPGVGQLQQQYQSAAIRVPQCVPNELVSGA